MSARRRRGPPARLALHVAFCLPILWAELPGNAEPAPGPFLSRSVQGEDVEVGQAWAEAVTRSVFALSRRRDMDEWVAHFKDSLPLTVSSVEACTYLIDFWARQSLGLRNSRQRSGALRLSELAVVLADECGGPDQRAQARLAAATQLSADGDYAGSDQMFDEACTIYRDSKRWALARFCLFRRAEGAWLNGRYLKARSIFDTACGGCPLDRAIPCDQACDSLRTILILVTGDPEAQALTQWAAAAEGSHAWDLEHYVRRMMLLSVCHGKLRHKELEAARRCFDRFVDSAPDDRARGMALSGRAQALLLLGRAEEALQVLNLADRGRDDEEESDLRVRALLALGRTDEAEKAAERTLKILSTMDTTMKTLRARDDLRMVVDFLANQEIAWRAERLAAVGSVREAQGRYPEAESAWQDALRLLDLDRSHPGERLAAHLARDAVESSAPRLAEAQNGLIRLAFDEYERTRDPRATERAWAAAEAGRGRLLAQAILRRAEFSPEAWLRPEHAAASIRLETSRDKALENVLRLLSEGATERATAARRDLAEQDAALDRFWSSLKPGDDAPERVYATLRSQRLGPADLALRPGEMLVQFHVDERATYRWAFSGAKLVRADRLKIGLAELDHRVGQLTNRIVAAGKRPEGPWVGDASLYVDLFGDLLEGRPDDAPLVIVPDGPLMALPFELLVAPPQPGKSREGNLAAGLPAYLGLQRPLSYAPSATALAALRARRSGITAPGRLFAVADPIFGADDPRCGDTSPATPESRAACVRRFPSPRDPGKANRPGPPGSPMEKAAQKLLAEVGGPWPRLSMSRDEVEAIQPAFGERSRLLRDEGVTEAAVVAALQDSQVTVVHLATHAVLPSEVPSIGRPALVLAPGEDNTPDSYDGFLTDVEVAGLRLKADMVVLSGCQTGVGERMLGEGLGSFAYAFMVAGARNLLVSMWEVDDQEAAGFMAEVYSRAPGIGGAAAEESWARALWKARRAMAIDGICPPAARGQGGSCRAQDRRVYPNPYDWGSFLLIGSS